MPYKFNAARRHKFAKKRYRVTNWGAYNESLRRRGDLSIWITDEALGQWSAPRRLTPGGHAKYSDLAIAICLTLRTVYKQPLRQTQGLVHSIARLMDLEIPVPDFSTLSRRGRGVEHSDKAPSQENGAGSSGRGQHWPENLRRGRMATQQV